MKQGATNELMKKWAFLFGILVLGAALTYALLGRRAKEVDAPPVVYTKSWALDALGREASYIVDCSYTQDATNRAGAQEAADGYGALNDVRIVQVGPDWVRTGEGAVASIGLMAAAAQLNASGRDIGRFDRTLGAYFRVWLLKRRQPVLGDGPDAGGMAARVYYDGSGGFQRRDAANASATGMTVAACWKYAEYERAIGRPQDADGWLRAAWPLARDAGEFLRRNVQAQYGLVRENAGASDLWVSNSVAAVCALRCLARWASSIHQAPGFDYDALAAQITAGIGKMQDTGTTPGFFKYRDAGRDYAPVYGDSLDQLGFLPYETGALDAEEPFARQVDDWYTRGGGGVQMTDQRGDPKDWRYYGLHWHHHFTPSADDAYLYPGPDLQLAKVEWKIAWKTGDRAALERAHHRFDWASQARYSDLWLGATGASESDVPNGVVDWRDANDHGHTAEQWTRFVDTSAYFIEVDLMLNYGRDTQYVPD